MPRGTRFAVIEIVPHQRDGIIRLIGSLKVLKALILVAGGVGLFSLGNHGGHSLLWQLQADPGNRYVNHVIAKLASASPHKVHELGAGCFIYAALFGTEGVGLLLRKLWAEYLTIVITGSFIPLEVYEMVQHNSWFKMVVIVVNIAIVIYLVLRLRRDKQWPFR
jgi:uncharacterized membrane protein (DUF2068 family)